MNSVHPSVRASRSHTRGIGGPARIGIIHCCPAQSFPFITLTLWPRPRPPRRAMPSGSAITPSAAAAAAAAPLFPLALAVTLHCLSISTLPIFGLESAERASERARDHQREKRTIAFGPNHHRAGDIKWTDGQTDPRQRSAAACPYSVVPVRPIDITTVIKVRARGRGGREGGRRHMGRKRRKLD